jgi:TatD DNase family protein
VSKKKKLTVPLPRLSAGVNMIDTHCHLDMSDYEQDCDDVIRKSFAAGVSQIITIGIDPASSKAAVRIAEQYSQIYASVGVHPHNVAGVTDKDYDELILLAGHPKVVGYGEIGIDLAKKYAPEALQKEHFTRQLRLAKELALPVIIHDREAHDEVMDILRKEQPFPAGGVMHCFSGDMALAREVLDLGFYISIPGVVSFNKAEEMQEVARKVPLNALIIETDGPFLSPVPMRGKRNEPAYVLYTAEKIADLRGTDLDSIAKITTENATRLFHLQRVTTH